MKISTTELVNKIYAFCEAYSGVTLFSYQAQFAKRIIRSVLENDGEEITALFSRQCVQGGAEITLWNGDKKPIEQIKIGDYVMTWDKRIVPKKVTNAYCTGKKEVYKLALRDGLSIKVTANHRFLDCDSMLFKPLSEFEAGDKIGYINCGKLKFSRIKSLRFQGEKLTFDLEVEGSENFICNDIVTHNSGKSETVALVSGGLSILLPRLARLPMFSSDKRIKDFKDGIMIGIFAPTLTQSQIVFNRMKKRMGSEHCVAIMSDPEIDVSFDVANGQNIILSNKSLITCKSASEGSNIEGDSYMLIIVDEAQDIGNFKYLKSISPMGAFYNATKILIGTATTSKGFFFDSIQRNKKEYNEGGKRNHFEYDYETVIKYNPKYEKYIKGEKKRYGEDSDEFKMAYKLQWILERGMFFDPKVFDKMALPLEGRVPMDTSKKHVVGIDLGKKTDSTIITVLEVNWGNPVLVEKSVSGNAEVPDYIAYDVKIKDWLEIQGDNWDAQYDKIISFISNYDVVRIVMDGTGVGDAIYDRLRANLSIEVIPYMFGSGSKDTLYKHLNTEARAGRVHYPADSETKETHEYQKFCEQCLSLEKTYRGQLMVVSHPTSRDAHDDYCDSLALAVYGAKGEGVSRPITETMETVDKTQCSFNRNRNRLTARRRR